MIGFVPSRGRLLLLSFTLAFHSTVSLEARPRRWGQWRRVSPRVLHASRDWRLDGSCTESIFPRGNHDFFELRLPEAGRLEIRHDVPPEIGSALRVHDERGPLTRWHDRATGQSQTLTVDVRRKGSVFVEVADTRDNDESRSLYTLTNSFRPHPDPWEPNDSREKARSVDLPVTLEGRIFPAGDHDRFRCVATSRGLVEIEALAVAFPLRLRLETRDGRPFLDWSLLTRVGEKRLVSWPGWGEFHLCLRGQDEKQAFHDPWKLAVRFHAKEAEGEELDDRVQDARLLPFNRKVEGRILPRADRDLWKSYVAGHGRVIVHLSDPPEDMAMRMDLRNAWNQSLCGGWKSASAGKELSVVATVNGWGWICVHVEASSTGATSLGSYGLRAEFFQRAWVYGQQAPRVHTETFGWPTLSEGASAAGSPVTTGEIESLIGDGEDPFGSIDDEW